MVVPYFVADFASVTIMRPLASSAFGKYSLTLPEGIEMEDVHPPEAPGNELGFVAQVARGRRVGGLARRFVRADVSVTAADESDEDNVPASDVDSVLREVAERVQGDFFLESDITKAGLGPWEPMVDFQVGDPAHVEVWGRVVRLPVTRIEPIVSEHDLVDWRVHVGGQLVSDEDARLAENETLRKALLQDRRELAEVDGRVRKAQAAATTAATQAAEVRAALAGPAATPQDLTAQLEALNTQLQEAGETSDDMALIPAYIAANTQRWLLQEQVDALQDRLLAEVQEQIAVAKQQAVDMAARRAETIMGTIAGSSHPDYSVVTGGTDGTWGLIGPVTVGDLVRVSQWTQEPGGALSNRIDRVSRPISPTDRGAFFGFQTGAFVEILRMETPLMVKRFAKHTSGSAGASTWLDLPGMSVTVGKATRDFDVSVSVKWPKAWGFYTLQVVTGDGTVLTSRRDQGKSDVFTGRALSQTLTVTTRPVEAGTVIRVRVLCEDNRNASYRDFSGSWSGSWTEQK